ncbi:hypothetical protein IKF12_03400 [Candidatus Saccharibacteria bacterium]|nr:hypothetical protein [Candidatus Saccharibacteria bacterium]
MMNILQFFADCGGVSTSLINCDSSDGEGAALSVLGLAVRIVTVAVGVLAAIGITIVGVQYLTAKDNEEQVRKAKKRLVQLVIGLVAFVLLSAVANFLIPGGFFNDFYTQYVSDSTSEWSPSTGSSSGNPSEILP